MILLMDMNGYGDGSPLHPSALAPSRLLCSFPRPASGGSNSSQMGLLMHPGRRPCIDWHLGPARRPGCKPARMQVRDGSSHVHSAAIGGSVAHL